MKRRESFSVTERNCESAGWRKKSELQAQKTAGIAAKIGRAQTVFAMLLCRKMFAMQVWRYLGDGE
jgi:hypothetical protein